MIIFESEENARAAGDRISAIAADAPDEARSMASRSERSSLRPDDVVDTGSSSHGVPTFDLLEQLAEERPGQSSTF
jgi:hypothetical protein